MIYASLGLRDCYMTGTYVDQLRRGLAYHHLGSPVPVSFPGGCGASSIPMAPAVRLAFRYRELPRFEGVRGSRSMGKFLADWSDPCVFGTKGSG